MQNLSRLFFSVPLIILLIFSGGTSISVEAATVTNPSNLFKQLSNQTQCGLIGQPCCKPVNIPSIRIGYINIPLVQTVVNPLIDFLNNTVLSITDAMIQNTSNILQKVYRNDQFCSEGIPSDKNNLDKCSCMPNATFKLAMLCSNISNGPEKTSCINCSARGVWTAIGCIDFNLSNFFRQTMFGLAIGFAGIFALLCIIYSSFMLVVSSGNPERIKKAQELLTSCIMGLILIIFSVFILRVIGIDILRIPFLR